MPAVVRRSVRVLGELALTLLAIGGALCIVLVIAAGWFGISIILFSTGSMSPTIPAGSAALVREIPASEVEVGDVVTVDRPGALPVTHRVVAVAGSGVFRQLTLRGDANPVDDPLPYDVARVREVIFSVPGIAPAIAAAGHPLTLAIVTLGVAGLVTWAFWPRAAADGEASERRTRRSRRPTGTTARHAAGAVLVVAAAVTTSMLSPQPAQAAAVASLASEQVVQGEVLRLTSILDAARAGNLEPGADAVWIVGVEAITDEPGTVDIALEFGAGAPRLTIAVAVCDERWNGTDCPSGARALPTVTAASSAARHPLAEMRTSEQRWLRLTVSLADGTDGTDAGTAGADEPVDPIRRELVVRATGFGESASIGPGGDIAATGPPFAPSALAAAAVLLTAAGAALVRRPRARDGSRG